MPQQALRIGVLGAGAMIRQARTIGVPVPATGASEALGALVLLATEGRDG